MLFRCYSKLIDISEMPNVSLDLLLKLEDRELKAEYIGPRYISEGTHAYEHDICIR